MAPLKHWTGSHGEETPTQAGRAGKTRASWGSLLGCPGPSLLQSSVSAQQRETERPRSRPWWRRLPSPQASPRRPQHHQADESSHHPEGHCCDADAKKAARARLHSNKIRPGTVFLAWLRGKESTCRYKRCQSHSWGGKIPWKRARRPAPVFLPGEPHRQRSLVGYIQSMGSQRVRCNLVTKQDPKGPKIKLQTEIQSTKNTRIFSYFKQNIQGQKSELPDYCSSYHLS